MTRGRATRGRVLSPHASTMPLPLLCKILRSRSHSKLQTGDAVVGWKKETEGSKEEDLSGRSTTNHKADAVLFRRGADPLRG